MPNQELRKKAIAWLDALMSLKGRYGSEGDEELLTYFEKATPQELMKDFGISEEEARKIIELTKSLLEYFAP